METFCDPFDEKVYFPGDIYKWGLYWSLRTSSDAQAKNFNGDYHLHCGSNGDYHPSWYYSACNVWVNDDALRLFHQCLMMMMMMMNCFCGMVTSSASRISDTLRAGFEPAQNLSSGLVEWSCAVVITTTTRRLRYKKVEGWILRWNLGFTLILFV